MQCEVEPSPRLYVIKSCDNYMKFCEEARREVLDLANMRLHAHRWTSLHDEVSRGHCLGLTHIFLTEQELSVQIRHVDRVHIDHLNITETGKSQIL